MKKFVLKQIDECCIPLWAAAFGDGDDRIREAISLLSDSALYAAITEEGVPITQCILIGHTLCGLRGLYIYAACTDGRLRGRGLFTELLKECEKEAINRGFDFLSLIPASEQLAVFYRKRGFALACALSANASPSDPEHFYGSVDPTSYVAERFDGDFERLYSLSDQSLSLGAFIYTLKTVEDVCETVYTNGRQGYMVRHRKDKSKTFDASSERKKLSIFKDIPGQEHLLIKPLRTVAKEICDTVADPLPR